jgi:S1-C subfamily serine protease
MQMKNTVVLILVVLGLAGVTPPEISANRRERESGPQSAAQPRKDIPTIAKAANGAIVTIIMANDDNPIAQGTGFLVRSDGVVVTNYHVIQTGNVAVAKFPDGTVLSVDGVLAADKVRDLAIVKIHGKTFRTLTLGNSDQIQVGEEVVAIGNPLSLESTVSNGIVSGMRTSKAQGGKFLQTTAPISPGSSGGPLFNMLGEVVGINTMYLEGGENLNFAIPINDAKRLLLVKSTKLRNLPNEPESIETQTQSHDENAPVPGKPKSEPTPDLPKSEPQWVVVRDTTLWRSLSYHGDGYGRIVSLHVGDEVQNVGSPDSGYRSVFVPTGGYHGYVSYDAVSNNEEAKRKAKHVITVIVSLEAEPTDSEFVDMTMLMFETMWSSLEEDGFLLDPSNPDFHVTLTRLGLGDHEWTWNIQERTSAGDLQTFKAGKESSLADCATAINKVLDDYRSSRPDLAQARPKP